MVMGIRHDALAWMGATHSGWKEEEIFLVSMEPSGTKLVGRPRRLWVDNRDPIYGIRRSKKYETVWEDIGCRGLEPILPYLNRNKLSF